MWDPAHRHPPIWDVQGTCENLDKGEPLVCKDRRDTWGRRLREHAEMCIYCSVTSQAQA